MKFDVGSDLHLMYGGYDKMVNVSNDGSKILVLAGDIVEVVNLRLKTKKKQYRKEVMEFLQGLNLRYENVLFVAGNHEHWGNSFYHTIQNLRSSFKEMGLTNFVVLEKETFETDNTILFGATMWTTLHDNDPIAVMDAAAIMKDYSQIHIQVNAEHAYSKYFYGTTAPLTPEITILECRETIRKIHAFAELETAKKKVLITHHAPCSLSVDPRYREDKDQCNYAYYEELGDVLAYSDIKVAIHGHMHIPVDYMVGDCRIVSNPRGYHGYEADATKLYTFRQVEI
jgi:predicted phosphodiesterase